MTGMDFASCILHLHPVFFSVPRLAFPLSAFRGLASVSRSGKRSVQGA